MAFFVRPLTSHEERLLRELAERYRDDAVILKRLNIILLSHQRMKSGEIARQLQITPSTIVHWIKRFNQFGINCFEDSLSREPGSSTTPSPDTEPLYARAMTSVETETLRQFMQLYHNRPHTIKRLQAIELSSEGIPVSEIVRILGLSQKTVRLWIKQFNTFGINRLETYGDKTWLTKQQNLLTPPANYSTL
jgi:transposase